MLVALLPEQISNMWPLLKGHIEDSLPPTADYGQYDTNNILYSLLTGNAQLWLFQNDKLESQGFVVTTIMSDISGVKTLLIYNMIVIDKEAKVDWLKEFATLRLFANSKGCSKLGSYIRNQKMLDVVKDYEVDTRYVFAFINI